MEQGNDSKIKENVQQSGRVIIKNDTTVEKVDQTLLQEDVKSVSQKRRISIIADLKKKAQEVRALKEKLELRRPIVIEFSGSPKSGKTTSINSLEVFLKRNNFKVMVVQEFASKCPVSNKQNPMFNIWTTCRTLASMIGFLENSKYREDILLVDRGIFDALCWFEWMGLENKMDADFKEKVEMFLLREEMIKCIDIVFSFTATPETSISREYAYLLTDESTDEKPSIMNQPVLQKYLKAIDNTRENKGKYFKKIIPLDTSLSNQDIVGKIVTEKTLETLQEVLMERIGYFEKNEALIQFEKSDELINILKTKDCFEYKDLKKWFDSKNCFFDIRDNVEINDNFLQIIPIAVITKPNDKILVVKKKNEKNDSPEKDRLLPYVGGHVRIEDHDKNINESFLDIFKKTLKREIKEEIGVSVSIESIAKHDPIIIYTPNNPTSSKHLAICFKVDVPEETKLVMKSTELIQNKGTSKSGSFLSPSDIFNEDIESWGKVILREYFSTAQYSLFPDYQESLHLELFNTDNPTKQP